MRKFANPSARIHIMCILESTEALKIRQLADFARCLESEHSAWHVAWEHGELLNAISFVTSDFWARHVVPNFWDSRNGRSFAIFLTIEEETAA